MVTIEYKLIYHRGAHRILVFFENIASWNHRIKAVAGARWSRTWKGWTIPDTPENRHKCGLDLHEESNTPAIPFAPPPAIRKYQPLQTVQQPRLSASNSEQLQRFIQQLTLKAYSSSTIRTYRNEFIQLLQLLGKIPVQDLQPEHLQRYILYCISQGLSENSVHSRINALKFYYEQVLHREKMFLDIPRPKKPMQLPKLLNKEELRRLFTALSNKKHKAMLFTAYSAGLRVSEVASLKIADIDSQRMQLLISRAKGKKDRYVNLSPILLDILRNYVQSYTPKPRVYLFESEQTGTAYPSRTIQQVFTNAKEKAGIKKEVGIHSLRHSFATHLLEKGVDIRYIKELLGHFNIKTTERYLHVSKQKLVNIISPLDDLMNNHAIEW